MDYDKELKDSIAKIEEARQTQNAEKLESELEHVKEIMDNPYKIDNSMDGAECLVEGRRRNIYRKGRYYFLGDATGTINKLYSPTTNWEEIKELFDEANADDID